MCLSITYFTLVMWINCVKIKIKDTRSETARGPMDDVAK